MPNQWQPMYPDFAVEPGRETRDAVADPDDTSGGEVPWVSAPADSHLWGFRFHDARRIRHLRTLADGTSRLDVRFKPPKNSPGKGITEYEYRFTDHATGEAVFQAMANHPDPGELVHSELIKKGVPYRKLRG